MEVDLLMLKDRQIIVWRDEAVNAGEDLQLSSLSLPEVRAIAHNDPNSRLNQMMTLDEFIDLVDGRVGVIFEIKVPYEISPKEAVDSVLSVIDGYRGDFAIHSANPYVIQMIRAIDPDIPLGQISLSFSRIPDVDPEYVRLHREFRFADIVMPDFLNYDIRDLAEWYIRKQVLEFCRAHDMPLLSWTIKSAAEERLAKTLCGNYIIEGATSYMD